MSRPQVVRRGARIATWAALGTMMLVAAPAIAQVDPNLARGVSAGGAYAGGGLDRVNLFNGNLMLGIPLGSSYPVGGGLTHGLGLSYNAKIWDLSIRQAGTKGNQQTYTRADPGAGFNAGLGWAVSVGELEPEGGTFVYRSADGGEHLFYDRLHIGESSVFGVYYTRDGSYLRLRRLGSALDFEVEFPDGTVRKFHRSSTTSPFKLTQIRDRFGNDVTVSQTTSLWTLSDGHRTQKVYFTPVGGQWVVDKVELSAFGGGTAEWDFDYSVRTIQEHCQDDDPTTGDSSGNVQVTLLTAVHLPADAGSFTFDPATGYYQSCNQGGTTLDALPGVLKKVQLPTRGSIEWTYQEYTFPVRTPAPPSEPHVDSSTTLGVASKTVRNAADQCEVWNGVGCTWTYSWANLPPTHSRRTVVTMPTGDARVHYFNQTIALSTSTWHGWQYGLPIHNTTTSGAGYYLSQEIWDGGFPGGVKKRSIYLGYEHDRLPGTNLVPQNWYNTNRRVQKSKTIFHDDGGKFASFELSQFDGLGHYRHKVTDGSFGDSDVRTEHVEYNPAQGDYYVNPSTNQQAGGYSTWPVNRPWVIATMTGSWASEGAARVESQTCFQQNNGFLAWERAYRNGTSPQATDTLVVYSRNSSGDRIAEAYYGGDDGGLPATTPSASCSLSGLPAPQYRIVHEYQHGALKKSSYRNASNAVVTTLVDLDIDQASALASRSRDVSGLATDLEYDGLGRLAWEKPQSGHDAWTEHLHKKATGSGMLQLARVEVRERANGSETGAVRSERWLHFDGLGRVAYDRIKLPGVGWTKVHGVYNAMGWPFAISQRHPDSDPDPQLAETKYFDYDPFGWPGFIRPPDGSAHDVTFSYAGVRAVTRTVKVGSSWNGSSVVETPSATTHVYDRQGRLKRVKEPAAGGSPAYEAVYDYDAAGRMTKVTMKPQSGGGTTQHRNFTYDGRGFLTAESHPEVGVVYSDHDALGNPRRARSGAVNGPFDLRLTYDRAERTTLIEEAGTGRDLKSFNYATSNAGANRRKGKLETAVRHNWIQHPTSGTLLDIIVTEDYTYAGRGGRVSQRDTSLNTAHSFTQAWSYNDLGQVTTLTYPTCTFTECAPANPLGSTVSHSYSDGLLTAVPGFATSISYHTNATVNQVQHANGVTWTHGLDPDQMARPASIGVAGGSVNQTLAYSYDGAGQVTRIGSEIYLYDPVQRLEEGRLSAGTQTYGYDPFGNLEQISTTPSGGSTTTQSFAIDQSTNRFSAVSYDAAGNQLSWGAYSYQYDAIGMLERLDGGGNETTYIYTADDERLWVVDSTTFPWKEDFYLRDLDGRVLRTFRTEDEFDGPWQWVEDYVYRGGTLLASHRPGEGVRHLHPDHLGTPRWITNSAGQSVGGFGLYPYGRLPGSNGQSERMRFTGHERDLNASFGGETDDLDYMHARYYSAMTGRFLSVDPIGGNPAVPQSWNRYAYALGSPAMYVDPSGEFSTGFAAMIYLMNYGFWDSITVYGGFVAGSGENGERAYDLSGFYRFFYGSRPGSRSVNGGFADHSLSVTDRLLAGIPDFLAQGTADVIVGFGDVVSFGLTAFVREEQGLSNTVREDSGFYTTGRVAGAAHGIALGGAGGARAAASTKLFGKASRLNKGRRFRIGHSKHKGRTNFSVRGEAVDRLTGSKGSHIDLFRVRPR